MPTSLGGSQEFKHNHCPITRKQNAVLHIVLNCTTSSNCDNTTKVVKKPDTNRLRACVWNAQGLRQKAQAVKDFTDKFGLDIFLFTETWLKADDKVEIGQLERNGVYFII